MKKRAEFDFVWIFAILAGIAILILAIYGVSKFGNTSQYQTNTQLAKQLTIFTSPMEAGFATTTFGKIDFNQVIKLKNICLNNSNDFGENEISIATKLKKDWSEFGVPITSRDKYIFSREITESQLYYVLSQSFEFPYKVADFIILIPSTDNYCFQNPPDEINEQLTNLKVPNIEINENTPCSTKANSIQVCFSQSKGCDIIIRNTIDNEQGFVKKLNSEVPFTKDLLLAAIFSEKENYECNLARLFYRASQQAEILSEKVTLMGIRDCNTNIDLTQWQIKTKYATANNIIILYSELNELNKANSQGCGLW